MQHATDRYSINPVNFDPDIQCERCNRQHATHYLHTSYPITVRGTPQYNFELCEDCAQRTIDEHIQQNTWTLMED